MLVDGGVEGKFAEPRDVGALRDVADTEKLHAGGLVVGG